MSATIFPLLIAYTLSFFVSIAVAVIGWRRRKTPGAFPLFIFAISEASWTFGLIAETSLPTLEAKIFWDNLQFISWLTVTASTIPFALEFGEFYQKTPLKWWLALLSAPAIAGVLAYTDDLHRLIRPTRELIEGNGIYSLYYPFTNTVIAMALFTYLATIAALFIVTFKAFKTSGERRIQAGIVIVGILIPLIGGLLSLAELVPAYLRDISPFTFGLSNIILAYGLLRYRLFDLIPIARDQILNEINNGIILLNNKNQLAFINPAAGKFLGLDQSNLGQPAPETITGWTTGGLAQQVIEIPQGEHMRFLEASQREISSKSGTKIGQIILLNDITERKTIEDQLKERTDELETRSLELLKVTNRAQKRANQLEAVSRVNRAVSAIQNSQELLERIANVIGDEFGFYHVNIYLMDAVGKYAILRASSLGSGKKLNTRGQSAKAGETGIVEQVISTGRPRIAVEMDDLRFSPNPDLPDSRSEIALPLIQNEKVIGALDIHSKDTNAFQSEDVGVMSILAAQVSIAIQNVRLFEEANRASTETQTLLQQFGQGQWNKIALEKNLIGFRFDGSATERLKEPVLMPKHGISGGDTDEQTLAVPIKVRGQVIGTLGIRPPKGHHWAPDEIDIINAVSERMAISAENARLLQDSQNRAAKEQTITAVSSKIGASFNLDSILRTAVEELGQIIPGSEVAIQLKRRND